VNPPSADSDQTATFLDLPAGSPGGSVELFLDLYTGEQPLIPAHAFMLAPPGPRRPPLAAPRVRRHSRPHSRPARTSPDRPRPRHRPALRRNTPRPAPGTTRDGQSRRRHRGAHPRDDRSAANHTPACREVGTKAPPHRGHDQQSTHLCCTAVGTPIGLVHDSRLRHVDFSIRRMVILEGRFHTAYGNACTTTPGAPHRLTEPPSTQTAPTGKERS
jgi:hypothetical protein